MDTNISDEQTLTTSEMLIETYIYLSILVLKSTSAYVIAGYNLVFSNGVTFFYVIVIDYLPSVAYECECIQLNTLPKKCINWAK